MVQYTVTDADAHYLEDLGELATYLDDDDPWKERFKSTTTGEATEASGSAPVSLYPSSTGSRNVFGRIQRPEVTYPEEMGPEDIPPIMDHLGLDNCVVLSQKVLTFGRIRGDDERMNKLSKTYTEYMLDKVVDPSEGIYTMIPAPFQDPEYTVELVDEYADEDGIVGLCMITAGPEPPLGNRRYEPIYDICEKKGLPVNFHTGGAGLEEFHIKGYEEFIETHTLGFLFNNMAQVVSLVVQGIPEKYPNLDIMFQESGIFWIPNIMHRLDAEYLKRPSEAPVLEKLPSEYMKEFYYGIQPLEVPENEEHLEHVIEMIGGADRLMYASDYPHWDYDRPSVITDREFLSEAEKARILSGTAEEVMEI
ncbi:amidohydrolase family protein [Halobellus sp. GM3]|uniref:amidohydrolase family protein n=1 Tax=Halobellus sp. GM3 TaxID=3458410 RepID=UPI00403E2CF3